MWHIFIINCDLGEAKTDSTSDLEVTECEAERKESDEETKSGKFYFTPWLEFINVA